MSGGSRRPERNPSAPATGPEVAPDRIFPGWEARYVRHAIPHPTGEALHVGVTRCPAPCSPCGEAAEKEGGHRPRTAHAAARGGGRCEAAMALHLPPPLRRLGTAINTGPRPPQAAALSTYELCSVVCRQRIPAFKGGLGCCACACMHVLSRQKTIHTPPSRDGGYTMFGPHLHPGCLLSQSLSSSLSSTTATISPRASMDHSSPWMPA